MCYESLFTRYGSPSQEAEIRITGHLMHPAKLTAGRIPWNDEQAARLISACEEVIEQMRAYRQALAARYAALETAPYHLRLELVRHPAWGGRGVTFDLTLSRIYEDGTKSEELREHYTGRERREALTRFEALKRSHPGIQAIADIEKRPWEK